MHCTLYIYLLCIYKDNDKVLFYNGFETINISFKLSVTNGYCLAIGVKVVSLIPHIAEIILENK